MMRIINKQQSPGNFNKNNYYKFKILDLSLFVADKTEL